MHSAQSFSANNFVTTTFFQIGVNFWPRDRNTEIVTKVVPVRAVDLSIGAFCAEFLRERFCDAAASRKIGHQGQEFGHQSWEIGWAFLLHAVAIVFCYMRCPLFFLHAGGRHPM